jgi:hypothetical protein
MVSLRAARLGLAANLRQLQRVEDVQVVEDVNPDPHPPTIQILPGPMEYHRAMGPGLTRPTLIIQAFTPFDEAGQAFLDRICDPGDPSSLLQAAESDQTLGGAATNVTVTDHGGVSLAQIGGNDVLLVEFTCIVYLEGA